MKFNPSYKPHYDLRALTNHARDSVITLIWAYFIDNTSQSFNYRRPLSNVWVSVRE